MEKKNCLCSHYFCFVCTPWLLKFREENVDDLEKKKNWSILQYFFKSCCSVFLKLQEEGEVGSCDEEGMCAEENQRSGEC